MILHPKSFSIPNFVAKKVYGCYNGVLLACKWKLSPLYWILNTGVGLSTLWFHLEDTVLLIGTVLLFSPILFSKYEVWLLIGSIPLAKEAWLVYGLCCFTKMSYPIHFWGLLFIWSMLNQNWRCDYYLNWYSQKTGAISSQILIEKDGWWHFIPPSIWSRNFLPNHNQRGRPNTIKHKWHKGTVQQRAQVTM